MHPESIPLKTVLPYNVNEANSDEYEELIHHTSKDPLCDTPDEIRMSPQFLDSNATVPRSFPFSSQADRNSYTKVSPHTSKLNICENHSESLADGKPDAKTIHHSRMSLTEPINSMSSKINIHSDLNLEFKHSTWSEAWNVELNHGIVMKGQMLLLRLAKAFFIFGAPLYRIEVRVKSVASHIGIPLSILTFPTSISLFFGDGTHVFWPQSFLIKGTQRLNMAKLQAIDRWAIKLSGGEQKAVESQIRERLIQSISECQEAQKEKYKRNPPSSSSSSSASPPLSFHPPFSQHSSYHSNSRKNYPHHSPHIEKSLKQVLVNPRPTLAVSEREMDIYLEELDKVVSQADVFHSNYRILSTAIIGSLLYTISQPVGWKDFLLSFGLSLMNGLLCRLGEHFELIILEVLIPMILSFVGKLLVVFLVPDICIDKVIILACFNFFPGIAITLSMVEFASGNLEAGTVRMFYSFIRSLKLGFGVSIGSRLVHWLFRKTLEVSLNCPIRPDTILLNDYPWLLFLLIVPLTLCINIFLLGNIRQFPIMSGVCFLGFLSNESSISSLYNSNQNFLETILYNFNFFFTLPLRKSQRQQFKIYMIFQHLNI